MPGLRRLRGVPAPEGGPRARSTCPVLLLSATFLNPDDQVEGLEVGADGYLTQPVEAPVLAATVRALLRTRRAETRGPRGRAAVAHRRSTRSATRSPSSTRRACSGRVNAAFAALFGQRARGLVGRPLADVAPQLASGGRGPRARQRDRARRPHVRRARSTRSRPRRPTAPAASSRCATSRSRAGRRPSAPRRFERERTISLHAPAEPAARALPAPGPRRARRVVRRRRARADRRRRLVRRDRDRRRASGSSSATSPATASRPPRRPASCATACACTPTRATRCRTRWRGSTSW